MAYKGKVKPPVGSNSESKNPNEAVPSTTGKQTLKAKASWLGSLPADHPIYKRGFAIGVTRGRNKG
jgi:hypothetical protein